MAPRVLHSTSMAFIFLSPEHKEIPALLLQVAEVAEAEVPKVVNP